MYGRIYRFILLCMFGVGALVKRGVTSDDIPVPAVKEVIEECECYESQRNIEINELRKGEPSINFSADDIELIALVTMAEAEGESEYGKRLVIDTILNRVDSVHYPDTVFDVVYQPNQFASMWDERVNRCYVMDEICELVEEELLERNNHEVIFFTADEYSRYGTPMFQEGNHYFSSYE